MYVTPLRCCSAIKYNTGVLSINNTNLGNIVFNLGKRTYAKGKDKDSCCKALDQAAGKKITEWPKSDQADPPPTAWRPECPSYPQPPNYDPYKIKVPDIAVPPLPPSNAKWTGMVLASDPHSGPEYPSNPQDQGYHQQHQHHQQQQQGCGVEEKKEEQEEGFFGMLKRLLRGKGDKSSEHMALPNEDGEHLDMYNQMSFRACQDLFHNSTVVHPDYWKNKPEKKLQELVKETLPKLGYHGRTKYKYAFHEPWKPLDRLALLEEAEREEDPIPDQNADKKTH